MHLPIALHRHPGARRAPGDENLRRAVAAARLLRVRNRTRATILVERCRVADDYVSRGIGLLLSRPLRTEEGLLITRTATITMLGMRFAIDAVFVDAGWRVVDIAAWLQPWVPVRRADGAEAVLELAPGAALASGTQVGDELSAEAIS